MQLVKLTMQAFGPFKDKVIIDFEKYDINKGLLLITGDTGAGKTTIFDAICFALYGEASGETRKTSSLRSDWADLNTETYVELEFIYNNKRYKVRRSPEYQRQSKRGEGTTKQPASAEFEINGRLEVKPTEVTKDIEELIGLTCKQFHQVGMLSQGEFTKFLLADAKEKNDIFRKIFNTNIYNSISNTLSINLSKKNDEYKLINDLLENEISKIDIELPTNITVDEEIVYLKTYLENKEKELEKERTILNELNQKISETKIELSKIKDTNKNIYDYNDSKEKLDNIIENNKNIEEIRSVVEYNQNVVPRIKEKLNNIESYKALIEDINKKLITIKQELIVLSEKQKSNQEEFKILDSYQDDIKKLHDKITEKEAKIKDYNSYKELLKEKEEHQENLLKIIKKYDIENKEYEEIKRNYYLDTASLLAKKLKDNTPCPVCGSLIHPNIATISNTGISKDDLELKEKRVNKILGERKTLESKIDAVNENIEKLRIDKNTNVNDLNNILKELKEEEKTLNKTYQMTLQEKNNIENSIVKNNENLKISNENILKYKELIEKDKNSLIIIYKENQTSQNEYSKKIIDDVLLKESVKRLKIYDNLFNTYKTKLEMLKDYRDKKIMDDNKIIEDLNVLNENYQDKNKYYAEEYSKYNRTLEIKNNIVKYNANYKKIVGEYEIIKGLSDTANGKLTGKKRITFENFVQSYYMNSILIEANKRLNKMTDGRYDLRNKKESTSLNDKGLDFTIFDAYTGKERDVTSLSGGEKFKAALSLALGLSDVISNYAGGIKMNVLFVDEGFGSLDQESLNQALNTLEDLTDDDKLVGIISHVEELINVIDKQIIVKKTNTGSSIEIKE